MIDRSRRNFLRLAAAAGVASLVNQTSGRQSAASSPTPTTSPSTAASTAPATAPTLPAKLDRRAIVARHNINFDHVDLTSPLQVGNGEFAFSLDVTGLQTIADSYRPSVPLNTMVQWAWHAAPNAAGYPLAQTEHNYDVAGRAVPYADNVQMPEGDSPAADYLRSNPHRIALARIAFVSSGAAIGLDELSNIAQTLDLWSGIVTSKFSFRGRSVVVMTCAHPTLNLIATRIVTAELSALGELAIRISFPGAAGDWKNPDDWDHPSAHTTAVQFSDRMADFECTQDATTYFARAAWTGIGKIVPAGPHAFDLALAERRTDLLVEFAPRRIDSRAPSADEVFAASAEHWAKFWQSGAAIDFSGCTDPRAAELERRVVLSQYLTAVNCAGSSPPQETGLLFSSWSGKTHLQSHWWHAAHFAMWDRFPLLDRSLATYEAILPAAKKQAAHQGYAGARWPAMMDPLGNPCPSEIDVFLIWQQPHPIYFAELAYRAVPTRETLERHAERVEQTAQFMASYARYDEATKRYVLGPALIPAQESYAAERETLLNPTFELAYWAWALTTAQKWRERLGKPREENWAQIVDKLSKPTIREGRYAAIETAPYLMNADHPSFLMAMGFLPKTFLIDEDAMRETARWTKAKWKWNSAWGTDFAVLAQTATRLGEPELAVDALTLESEKNRFVASGHNFQVEALPVYLPGNGALLAAVALMAGGWEGGPDTPLPGFPKNGRWDVKCEGFARMI